MRELISPLRFARRGRWLPAAPVLTWQGNHIFSLSAAHAGSIGFLVERSADGTTGWTQVDRIGPEAVVWMDRAPGALNYYRVREANAYGPSAYSNVVNDVPGPVRPNYARLELDARSGYTAGTGTWVGSGITAVADNNIPAAVATSYAGGPGLNFIPAGTNLKLPAAAMGDESDLTHDFTEFLVYCCTVGETGGGPGSTDDWERRGNWRNLRSYGAAYNNPRTYAEVNGVPLRISDGTQLGVVQRTWGVKVWAVRYIQATNTMSFWQNNIKVCEFNPAVPTAAGAADHFIGVAAGQTFWTLGGHVNAWSCYRTTALSDAEMQAETAYLAGRHFTTGKIVVCSGNSNGVNAFGWDPWSERIGLGASVALSRPVNHVNACASSQTWDDMETGNVLWGVPSAGAAKKEDRLRILGRPTLLPCQEDTNRGHDTNAAGVLAASRSYCANRKAQGHTVALIGALPVGPNNWPTLGGEDYAARFNAIKAQRDLDFPTPHPTWAHVYLPAAGVTYADYYVRTHDDATFNSADGWNTGYYRGSGDDKHLSDSGQAALTALIQPLINGWLAS